MRPFLEEAAQVLLLLRAISAGHLDPFMVYPIGQAELVMPAIPPNRRGTLLEPLSDREREVLGDLPSHLTGPEIAARIYVSPNTLKSHQKSTYRKRGAASRGEAVATAVAFWVVMTSTLTAADLRLLPRALDSLADDRDRPGTCHFPRHHQVAV